MKRLFLALLLFFTTFLLSAQGFECLTPHDGENVIKSSSINDWSLYSGYNYEDTPIKYIRVTLHVFNQTNGTGNFPDNQTSRDWLSGFLWTRLNDRFTNLSTMNLECPSPFHLDTRVRFVLANIYFWRDDNGWDFYCPDQNDPSCQNTHEKGSNLYNTYVTNKPNVMYKDNSVHVFLGENQTGKGRASGIGDKRWVMAAGVYTRYLNNQWWRARNLLAHELGHSLGLRHTWHGGDGCADTPTHSNCWNTNSPDIPECEVPSNNLMDYNASQSALTQCQINIIHYYLLGNRGNISDCLVSGASQTTPELVGSSVICPTGTNISTTNIQFGSTISWSVSPASAVNTATGFGPNAQLTPMSSANTAANLTFSIGYGDYGTRSASRAIVTNRLTSNRNVCGTLNGTYHGLTINASGTGCSSQTATINSGRNVTFIAPQEVNLNSGFEVRLGGSFEIISTPNCP